MLDRIAAIALIVVATLATAGTLWRDEAGTNRALPEIARGTGAPGPKAVVAETPSSWADRLALGFEQLAESPGHR